MDSTAHHGTLLRARKLGALVACVLGLMLIPVMPAYAERPTLEYQVKASMLFNFLQFIDWPDSAFEGTTEDLTLCIVGEPKLGSAESAMEGELVGSRAVRVRHFDEANDEMIEICRAVYFIGRSPTSELFEQMSQHSILSVGESGGFCTRGGIINFVVIDGKLRFEINGVAAKHAKLRVSAKLFRLANQVIGASAEPQ